MRRLPVLVSVAVLLVAGALAGGGGGVDQRKAGHEDLLRSVNRSFGAGGAMARGQCLAPTWMEGHDSSFIHLRSSKA